MVKYFRLVSLALLLSVGMGSVGIAASFDCNKAATDTEIAICDSRELSALDDILGFLWKQLVNKNQANILSQREWLLKRDACGLGYNCISVAYRQNLKKISGINKTLVGWEYNSQILHPYCFIKEWYSSDNFQAYYEHYTGVIENYYHTKNYEDFSKNTGLFFGSTITSYSPIKSSWDESIELAVSTESCANKNSVNLDITNQKVSASNDRDDYYYEILASVSIDLCHKLAPNIIGTCKESYVLKVADWGGGSMGHTSKFIVYGLFDITGDENYIIPLKTFVIGSVGSTESNSVENSFSAWSFPSEDSKSAIHAETFEVDGNSVKVLFEGCYFDDKTKFFPVINTEGSDWHKILGTIWVSTSDGNFKFGRSKLYFKGGRYVLSNLAEFADFTKSILKGEPFSMLVTVNGKENIIRSENKNINIYEELDC